MTVAEVFSEPDQQGQPEGGPCDDCLANKRSFFWPLLVCLGFFFWGGVARRSPLATDMWPPRYCIYLVGVGVDSDIWETTFFLLA